MRIIRAKLLILLLFLYSKSVANNIFVGYLSLPFKKNSIDFCIYFDGACIPVQYSTYLFTAYSPEINILVTSPENVVHQLEADNCTVTLLLKKNKKKNFCFYKLKRIVKGDMYTWQIQESEIDEIIPLNTIRLQVDPSKIDVKLENVTWKINAKKIKLPQIVISGNKNTIKDQLLRCCMSLVDSKPFCSKQKIKEVESDGLTLKSVPE